jgi:hypothetical protein
MLKMDIIVNLLKI